MQNQSQSIQKKILEVDAGILDLLDKRTRLQKELAKIEKNFFRIERQNLAKLIEKKHLTIIPDEKILEIWGKIIEIPKDMVDS